MTLKAHRICTLTAAVAIAAAAALAGPSVVSADTTSAFNALTRTATITGDGDSDKLVISDQGGLLKQALNDGAAQNILDDLGQPLPADRSVNLVVNSGAGDDQVQIATNLLQSATVDGGAGLDAIT